jgi:hypothetical protein
MPEEDTSTRSNQDEEQQEVYHDSHNSDSGSPRNPTDGDSREDLREEEATTERDEDPDSTRSKRLFIIQYAHENERKRAEYTLKNWEDSDVERPGGTIRIVETGDQDGLMNKLLSTIPHDHVTAYDLDDVEISETTETVTIQRTLSGDPSSIETTLDFMMSNQAGNLINPDENKYEISSKMGPAEVSYDITPGETPEESQVTLEVSGAPQTTDHIIDQFREQLRQFEQNRGAR